MRISVVGLGKIGLPVAVCYAAAGHDVIGCDVNPAVVDAVNAGRVPTGIAGVDDELPEAVAAGRLEATTDTTAAVEDTEVTVLLVPIGVDGAAPDYRHMDEAVRSVERGLRPGHLVVFEVLSPSTEDRDRNYKTKRLLGLGVKEVWLVDRHGRTIERVDLEGARQFRGDEPARSRVIDGFQLVPGALFAPSSAT